MGIVDVLFMLYLGIIAVCGIVVIVCMAILFLLGAEWRPWKIFFGHN